MTSLYPIRILVQQLFNYSYILTQTKNKEVAPQDKTGRAESCFKTLFGNKYETYCPRIHFSCTEEKIKSDPDMRRHLCVEVFLQPKANWKEF